MANITAEGRYYGGLFRWVILFREEKTEIGRLATRLLWGFILWLIFKCSEVLLVFA